MLVLIAASRMAAAAKVRASVSAAGESGSDDTWSALPSTCRSSSPPAPEDPDIVDPEIPPPGISACHRTGDVLGAGTGVRVRLGRRSWARQKGNITLAKALDVTRFEGGPEPGSFRSWSTKGLILNVKSDIDGEVHITLG